MKQHEPGASSLSSPPGPHPSCSVSPPPLPLFPPPSLSFNLFSSIPPLASRRVIISPLSSVALCALLLLLLGCEGECRQSEHPPFRAPSLIFGEVFNWSRLVLYPSLQGAPSCSPSSTLLKQQFPTSGIFGPFLALGCGYPYSLRMLVRNPMCATRGSPERMITSKSEKHQYRLKRKNCYPSCIKHSAS